MQSYNFAGGQHLADQAYQNCFRQEQGFCIVNFAQTSVGTTPNTFGVSINTTPNTEGAGLGTGCITDYLTIPFGFNSVNWVSFLPPHVVHRSNSSSDPCLMLLLLLVLLLLL